MILDSINDFVINIIKILIFIIKIIIAIIIFTSISNLFVFNIYNINSIFTQYFYESSVSIKLKDIYSYMLINYIHLLNKTNTLELKLIRDDKKTYKVDDTINLKFKDDIDKRFLHIQNKDNKKIPKNNKTILLTKTEENLLTYYIKMNDNKIMLKADYKDKRNNNYYKYKALYYRTISYYNSLEISDKRASHIYIHVCNKYYEYIVILILIIFSVIFTIYIFENCLKFYGDNTGKGNEYGSTILVDIYKNHVHILFVIILVLLYSIFHGLIYKNIFIDTVYNGLYENYEKLLHPDIYVRSEINNIYNYINNIKSPEIKERLYDSNINILKILANGDDDNILDSVINKTDTIDEQVENYTKYVNKLIEINKDFRISTYKSNRYILKYIEHILNINPSNNYLIDNNYIVSSMFLYIIYSYFINKNVEDPHIINKLNKILLNDKIIIGNDNDDEDIEYTLLLRSLLTNDLDYNTTNSEINLIMKDVLSLYEEHYNLNIEKYTGDIHNKNILLSLNDEKMPSIIKKDLGEKLNKFCDLLKETSNNINFGKHIFNLNIYLTLEVALNLILISCIFFQKFTGIFEKIYEIIRKTDIKKILALILSFFLAK